MRTKRGTKGKRNQVHVRDGASHFHYIVMGAIAFAGFGGIYYWYPIVTGRMYQRTLAKWHFWLSMIGTYDFTVGPVDAITALHQIATLGAFLIAVGTVIWLWNMIQSWYEAPTLEDGDPWDLANSNQLTREWAWQQRRLETEITDGGTEEVAADGGENYPNES